MNSVVWECIKSNYDQNWQSFNFISPDWWLVGNWMNKCILYKNYKAAGKTLFPVGVAVEWRAKAGHFQHNWVKKQTYKVLFKRKLFCMKDECMPVVHSGHDRGQDFQRTTERPVEYSKYAVLSFWSFKLCLPRNILYLIMLMAFWYKVNARFYIL